MWLAPNKIQPGDAADVSRSRERSRGRSKAQTVNLVGLEAAGLWSYFARTLAGDGVNLAADLVQFAADTDAEFVNKLYIPGLRKAGDFRIGSVDEPALVAWLTSVPRRTSR